MPHHGVAEHLVAPHFVDIKVVSCGYPISQQGNHNLPAGATFHDCVNKRWFKRCSVTLYNTRLETKLKGDLTQTQIQGHSCSDDAPPHFPEFPLAPPIRQRCARMRGGLSAHFAQRRGTFWATAKLEECLSGSATSQPDRN